MHEVQDKLVTFRLVLIYYSGSKYWPQKYFTENIESIWASTFKMWAKIKIQEQFSVRLFAQTSFSKVRFSLAFIVQILSFPPGI